MRLTSVRIGWLAIAAAATGCFPVERGGVEVARMRFDTVGMAPVIDPEFIRANPAEIAERAVIGGLVGGMLGAGVGAITSPNPAIGAMVGGPTGAVLGGLVGIATVQPLPTYAPIAVPIAPMIPGFYDTWPPGYRSPPLGTQVAPPPKQFSSVAAELPVAAPGDEAVTVGPEPLPASYPPVPVEAPYPAGAVVPPSL